MAGYKSSIRTIRNILVEMQNYQDARCLAQRQIAYASAMAAWAIAANDPQDVERYNVQVDDGQRDLARANSALGRLTNLIEVELQKMEG